MALNNDYFRRKCSFGQKMFSIIFQDNYNITTICNHRGKQYGGSQKTRKKRVSYEPAISLLGEYPDKTITRNCARTPAFLAALFTIAKTWKQPKSPLTGKWIKTLRFAFTIISLSHKKEWNDAVCHNMDGPGDDRTE